MKSTTIIKSCRAFFLLEIYVITTYQYTVMDNKVTLLVTYRAIIFIPCYCEDFDTFLTKSNTVSPLKIHYIKR